jgi:hypothetical protein
MESANLHHQHQLQDQFVGSSSLTTATPSSYAEAGSARAWTQTITLWVLILSSISLSFLSP